jgi:hypothetical protein
MPAGPRGDEFTIELVMGGNPSGKVADKGGAGAHIANDGKAIDITWVIPTAGTYTFVAWAPSGDPEKKPTKVNVVITVDCDPAGSTFAVAPQGAPSPGPQATPNANLAGVRGLPSGSGSSGSGSSGSSSPSGSGTTTGTSGSGTGTPGPAGPGSDPTNPGAQPPTRTPQQPGGGSGTGNQPSTSAGDQPTQPTDQPSAPDAPTGGGPAPGGGPTPGGGPAPDTGGPPPAIPTIQAVRRLAIPTIQAVHRSIPMRRLRAVAAVGACFAAS